MRDATELVSKPVLDMARGREVGHVKDAVFQYDEHRLLGLIVERDEGERCFLKVGAIRGLGIDAVTIDDESFLTEIAAEPEARAIMESGIHLRGTKIFTENGEQVGTLDRIMLDDDGVAVESYVAAAGLLNFGNKKEIRPGQVRSIGADAIVVTPQLQTNASTTDARDASDLDGVIELGPGTIDSQQTPEGTDSTKQTVVSVPDSQPGNLIDDELPPTRESRRSA
jgi:uncharacterized protein YrrD